MLVTALVVGCYLICVGVIIRFYTELKDRKKDLDIINNQTIALWNIEKLILNSLDFNKVTNNVVNETLKELSKYGHSVIVLSLIDEKRNVLKRISISSTEQAKKTLQYSPIPFNSIEIPLTAEENLNIKALKTGKFKETNKLADLLTPVINPSLSDQAQLASGIKASIVYPVSVEGKVIGTVIFSMLKDYRQVIEEERTLLNSFVDLVGLAIQNSKLYTTLDQTSRQLRVANAKLEELDKLKDDFVSVASHELRTPMTAIRSYAWMALYRSDMPLTEKMKRYLSRTLLSTERLINLVNEMLNISRIESGRVEIKPEVFNIQRLAKDVLDEVSIKAGEKHLTLKIDEVNRMPGVFADMDKVHQILLNLIGNAIKFTPENGLIEVKFAANKTVVGVAVKDSGAGILPDDQKKLFKKFGRLDNSYVTAGTTGGTGLGLYISKSLVDLMGGEIWVTSEGVGKGSTFYFTLPVASMDALAQAEKYHLKPEGEIKGLEPVAI